MGIFAMKKNLKMEPWGLQKFQTLFIWLHGFFLLDLQSSNANRTSIDVTAVKKANLPIVVLMGKKYTCTAGFPAIQRTINTSATAVTFYFCTLKKAALDPAKVLSVIKPKQDTDTRTCPRETYCGPTPRPAHHAATKSPRSWRRAIWCRWYATLLDPLTEFLNSTVGIDLLVN